MNDREWATVRALVEQTIASCRASVDDTSGSLDVGDWSVSINAEHMHQQVDAKAVFSLRLPSDEAVRASEVDNARWEAKERAKADRAAAAQAHAPKVEA